MARLLYSLLLTLLLPLILMRLFIKGSSDNRYRRNIGDRLGQITRPLGTIDVWIHAVSVGEVNAAVPLVTAFRKKHSHCRILITTTTPTGLDQVTAHLGDRVVHCYLPFDHPFFIARFLRTISPRLLIIMERELWPNIIHGCHKRSIPVVIANARLSQRSCNRYAYVLPLMRPALAIVSAVAAQTEADRSRLMRLGAHPDHILTTGNIKYDVTVSTKTMDTAQSMRQDWGRHRLIIVAGSTHEGEEAALLDIFDPLREHYPGLLLILAPRHPERFDAVFQLVKNRGFNTHRHGDGSTVVPPSAEVHLRDTMGELPLLYAAADIAIVGGSLIEIKGIGGHNLLEPCAVATPVLFGRYISDFLEISHNIVEREAGIQVHEPNELRDTLKELLNDAALRNRMGANGIQVIKENRGATQRTLELCIPLIESDVLVREH
ncbi:lipid IV(A) 3-deoxy-D-manno-octulosonic acid transferase [Gammaproteobacteria bacterium]|nr:lipid IV(A) 3-deoxy-D-manno-octulosonic acid transferase [Gammaproteobacteria bacterium]